VFNSKGSEFKTGCNGAGILMKPKPHSCRKQGNFLYQDLLEQLNPKAPLLAKKIP
jgi:hypothetical protein